MTVFHISWTYQILVSKTAGNRDPTVLPTLWIWKLFSKLLVLLFMKNQPMTITMRVVLVAPATTLSTHQVLAPLQIRVPALAQAVAPPLHRRQLTRNSKRRFIHYLLIFTVLNLINIWLLQLATWTLPPKPHSSKKPWPVSLSGRSTSTWNLQARVCIRKGGLYQHK